MPSLSVTHAIKQDKIALLRKIDRPTTKAKVMQLVTRCTQLVNVQHNMNALQIEFCAENIIEKMWMYSLQDVQLCLDRGAIGQYGTLFNRIDPATIIAWFVKYDQQRQIAVETINNDQQKQNNIYEIFDNEEMLQAAHYAVDKLSIKEQAPDTAPTRHVTPIEKMIMDEYAVLPLWRENANFKWYKNTPYQFTEYRKERYMEEIDKQDQY